MENPVANPNPPNFEPDGTWYSMISARGWLYAVEPNHGEFDSVSLVDGSIHRVVDISASPGHIVRTAVAYHDGNFYVGNLSTFPIVPGASKIQKITPSGHLSTFATGFNTILGLAFDEDGSLYVLENTVGQPSPTPGFGRVLKLCEDGKQTVAVDGLSLPTATTSSPDGDPYISANGFGFPAGAGQVLKVTLHRDD